MAIDPSIFDGTPAAAPAVGVAAAPAAVAAASVPDAPSVFDGAPPDQAAVYPVVAPRYLEPDEPGYVPDAMVNMSREHWARFHAGLAPEAGAAAEPSDDPPPPAGADRSADRSDAVPTLVVRPDDRAEPADAREAGSPAVLTAGKPSPAPGKTGYVANVGAGGNVAAAEMLGLPVDLATGAINLGVRGVNAGARALGYAPQQTAPDQPAPDLIPQITDPVGGSASIKRAMGWIGANPDDVQATSTGQEIARGIGGGAVSAILPAAGIVPGLVRMGAIAAKTAPAVLDFAGHLSAPNALLGAASGGAGAAGASMVPDPYKPVAGLVAGVGSVGAGAGAVMGLRSAVRAVGDYRARVNPLFDMAGQPITAADGTSINMLTPNDDTAEARPLRASPNQARRVGARLLRRASNPSAVREALWMQGPPVIGGAPTTAQLTRDPGLLAAERGVSKAVPDAQGPFLARAAGENDARVRRLQAIGAGADPAAVPAELQGQASAADAGRATDLEALKQRSAAGVDAASVASKAAVSSLEHLTEQNRAAREADSAARLAGLQGRGALARGGSGGDLRAGAEGQAGAGVRGPMAAAKRREKAEAQAALNAVDPDGKLAVDRRPLKQGADAILRDMPRSEKPPEGEEAEIFRLARSGADVEPFRELAALRSRITDELRQQRGPQGSPPAVRRLSMLLNDVHKAMDGSVAATAEDDARAVANGTLDPGQTTANVYRRARDSWQTLDHAAEDIHQQSQHGSGATGRDDATGPEPVSAVVGAAGPGVGEPGINGETKGGNPGLSDGQANETLTPLPGSNRRPETLHDFVISKGGVQDQAGEYTAQDLDRIHHRAGGRLINPRGLSEDYMRELAVGEGFLPANADINDFRDAMTSQTPVYRIEEAHEASVRSQQRTQAWQEEEARYNARDAVSIAADQAGARLSRAEVEHATDLAMRGVHPEEAIRQATAATEQVALDRNAAANAIGSPGVPLAAQQADNGMAGAGRLAANFDAAANERATAARRKWADYVARCKNAPGVGEALAGGSQAGSFKLPDYLVTRAIFKPGPDGAGRVRAYLNAGGSYAALSDAAAFGLRGAATRADGTLDPAKVAAWMNRHSSALSELPSAAARFGDAAGAQRAVDVARRAEAIALKSGNSADAQAMKIAEAEADRSLKQATATAQRTVDAAASKQADEVKARQKSVIGRFLGEADPVVQVSKILRSATAVADMRRLAQAVAGNPDAQAGLQRAVADYILGALKGDAVAAGGEESLLHGAQLQKFLRLREPALREIMTSEQMASMRNVAMWLERSNLSVAGSKMGGGSDTVQIAASGAEAARSTFLGSLKSQASTRAGTMFGSGVGFLFGGTMGSIAGAGVGFAGDMVSKAVQAAKEAGIRNEDDLFANAMLHPSLAAVLVAHVTDNNRESLGRALVSQLRRISLVSGAVGVQNQGRPQPPRNALMH